MLVVTLMLAGTLCDTAPSGASSVEDLQARGGLGDSRLALTWEAAPTCPSQLEVVANILHLLSPGAVFEPLVVDARAWEHEGHWYLQLSTRSATAADNRTLDGESCAVVSDAAAVIIALTLDPGRGLTVSPGEPATVLSPTPLEPEREVLATGIALRVRLGGLGEVGIHPRVGAALVAGAGVALDLWSLEVSATYSLPQRVEATGVSGARMTLAALALRGCRGLRLGEIDLAGCALAEVGRQQARGFGVSQARTAHATWAAPGMSVVGDYELDDPLFVWAEVSGLVPFARPRFSVETVDAETGAVRRVLAARASRVVGRAGIGLGMRF